MNGMISTILIDIDDTLLDFNLCAEWAMEETAKKMKLLLPQNTYDYFKKINASLWKQMEKKEITSDGIYCVRWERVFQAVGVPFDGKEFEKYFLDNLSKSTIEVDGASELLEYLSGYFVSEKIGHSKPTREFFDVCYKETHVADVSELMMIGDSLSADIKGADDYGIKTCWFDKELKSTENLADYTVKHLLEIKAFL